MLKFIKSLTIADLVTLGNAVFGILSIRASLDNNPSMALYMILAAITCDFLDGKTARLTKKTTTLGHDLDSLSDAISFGVAPAIFLINTGNSLLTIISAIIFALCGILRLARFNTKPVEGGYEGMPIPLPSVIIAIYWFAHAPVEFLPYLYLVLAVLMISTIKIKKVI
ncbi:MAG: cdp-diacylglycerol-serine O-phosphatidyltransferase [uncultured bacterium]|nr:MAG: cdp-diacylglycerol-serine O-phosphatidyltransferase [uncultured bacterium]OGJ47949.1 MAG: CDP-diacylglycerol--serine O-phosphatidyltransferase [Candidatus Peregrinibacteria bacterium RIFOXYB12_FULL_41_12]OGJ48507.1 MAG: CDP-diacylglycerol--serine O-phosphatidyltransferase [Candidatus Peregrinibacteria bacterium RIFOXYA2_FULL_41_18]OGJ52575.1 MAG: CDP-diacylglycerol--serine O-phosphatidyltransferase [Candidatus Peregrinibacteria bacterium RIFOXYB2_FULL_41_88]OGJ53479.1 MAG: CDP-diacylgly